MLIKVIKNGKSFKVPGGEYELDYALGKITHKVPDSLGIFCYDMDKFDLTPSLRNKEEFGIEIYEVEVFGNPVKEFKMCPYSNIGNLSKWYQRNSDLDYLLTPIKDQEEASRLFREELIIVSSWEGSVLFDAVRLIRKIK